jgi:hypothetical protein
MWSVPDPALEVPDAAPEVPEVLLADDGPVLLPEEEVPSLLLAADEELPVVPVSAWAIPDPLASAAPKPSVIAPAPSHEYGSRRVGLAR